MNYKILINDIEIGIFGHDQIEHFHFAITGEPAEMNLHVNGIVGDGKGSVFFEWLKTEIGSNPKIEIIPTELSCTKTPQITYKLNNSEQASKICDFCRRDETEVEKLLYIDSHQPAICSECVDRCQQLLKSKV